MAKKRQKGDKLAVCPDW